MGELIRLLLACLMVLVVPGFVLTAGLRRRLELRGSIESLLLSVVTSYAVILLVSATVAWMHGNLTASAWAWCLFLIPLGRWPWKQVRLNISPVLLGALGWIFVLAWNLEPLPGGEEALELIPIRKILENSHISFFNLTQFPETAGIYLYFPYYFMLALIAKFSFLPMEVAYVKLRSVYALLSLLGFYGLYRRLFGDEKEAEWATGLVCLAIVLNPGIWEWPASVFPLCRRGAFAMGVLTPLGAWLALLLGRKPLEWRGLAVAALFSMAFAATHPLELAMLFFFLLAQLLTRSRPDRPAAGAVLLSFLAGALLFRATQSQLHLAANEMEGYARAGLLRETLGWLGRPLQGWLSGVPDEGRYVISETGSMAIYSFLGILFLPWLIGSRRRAGALLSLAVLLPLSLYSSLVGVRLLSCLTSAAVVRDVAGYFSLLGLLMVLGSSRSLVGMLARPWPPRARWAGVWLGSLGLVLPACIAWLTLLRQQPEWALVVGLLGAVGGGVAAHRTGLALVGEAPGGQRMGSSPRIWALMVPLMIGLAAWRPELSVPKSNAWQRWWEAQATPSVADAESYYPYFQAHLGPVLDLPFDMVRDLRKIMVPEQVLIHDPRFSQSVPVVLNCYAINPQEIYGHYFMPAIPYMQKYVHQGVHPIYNSGSELTPEEDDFLRSYSVRYLLVNPRWQSMARHKLAAHPERFRPIYQAGGFSAYEVVGR